MGKKPEKTAKGENEPQGFDAAYAAIQSARVVDKTTKEQREAIAIRDDK